MKLVLECDDSGEDGRDEIIKFKRAIEAGNMISQLYDIHEEIRSVLKRWEEEQYNYENVSRMLEGLMSLIEVDFDKLYS